MEGRNGNTSSPRVKDDSRSISRTRSSYDADGESGAREDDVVENFEKAQRRARRGVDGVEGGREPPVGVVNSGVGVNVSVNGDANVRWKGKGRDREVGVS